jgi:succinate-acetate transporter protein
MSAINEPVTDGGQAAPDGLRASIFLQPIAAPSVLGYFAGASGFLLFGLWLAGAVGGAKNGVVLFPFLLLFPGIGQLAAAMWSYKARDATAASIHGAWGGFWTAYGLLWLLDAAHVITLPPFAGGFQPLGQWFIYMAVITWTTAFAALARSPAQFVSQGIAAVASTIAAAALIAGSGGWQEASGWIFVAASALFSYHGAALMLDALFGRIVLPHFHRRREENRLGAEPLRPIEFPNSEPGVKVGQ